MRAHTDLQLGVSAAQSSHTPIPLGGLAAALYAKLATHDDMRDRDFSVVWEYLGAAQAAKWDGTRRHVPREEEEEVKEEE